MIEITQLINSPTRGIVGLYNPNKQKIYMVYASSVIHFFTDNLKLLCDGTHPDKELQADANDLVFKVLEDTTQVPGHAYGKYRLGRWLEINKYAGIKYYNTVKPLKVVPKVLINNTGSGFGNVASVFLVLPRYQKIKVKDFDRLDLANDYLNNTSIDDMFLETIIS